MNRMNGRNGGRRKSRNYQGEEEREEGRERGRDKGHRGMGGADDQYKNRDDERGTNRGLQVGQCNTQFSSDQFTHDTFNSI